MDIEEIGARLEIQQVLTAYCRGVDRRDSELIKSAYFPDAIDDHAMFFGKGSEFAAWIDDIMEQSDWEGYQHHLTHSYIEYHGDWAGVESYYLAFHPTPDKTNNKTSLLWAGGRYLDRFELRDGVWKIALRRCTMDWSRDVSGDDLWQAIHSFPELGKGRDDVSYGILSGEDKRG